MRGRDRAFDGGDGGCNRNEGRYATRMRLSRGGRLGMQAQRRSKN